MSDRRDTVIYVTRETYEAAVEELKGLRERFKKENDETVEAYNNCGDTWAHNSFYDHQQLQRGAADKRLAEAEQRLASFQIVETPSERPTDRVSLFSKVEILKRGNDGEEEQLTLEILPFGRYSEKGKVPYNSPIAKNIMGLTAGEESEARLPTGRFTLEVLEIMPEKLSRGELTRKSQGESTVGTAPKGVVLSRGGSR